MNALCVVETDDNVYLGTVEIKDGYLIIRTGYRGHPHYVRQDKVVDVEFAWLHPDVEYITVA